MTCIFHKYIKIIILTREMDISHGMNDGFTNLNQMLTDQSLDVIGVINHVLQKYVTALGRRLY